MVPVIFFVISLENLLSANKSKNIMKAEPIPKWNDIVNGIKSAHWNRWKKKNDYDMYKWTPPSSLIPIKPEIKRLSKDKTALAGYAEKINKLAFVRDKSSVLSTYVLWKMRQSVYQSTTRYVIYVVHSVRKSSSRQQKQTKKNQKSIWTKNKKLVSEIGAVQKWNEKKNTFERFIEFFL